MLRESAAAVSLTHVAKEFMIDQWNVSEHKIHVIPCAADYSHFAEQDKTVVDEFRLKHYVPVVSGKTLIYIGSTGTWYMLKEMFNFYSVFRKHFPGSRFLLCINETNSMVEEMKLQFQDEIAVLQRIPRNEMPLVLSLADYSIMFRIKPAFSKMASSPMLGESLAMGVPVICNAGVGDMGTIEQEGFWSRCESTAEEEYIHACERLAAMTFSVSGIRLQSEMAYDLNRNVAKYRMVYNEFRS